METKSDPYPRSTSVYELIRLRPALRTPLLDLGLTDDYLGYRVRDAARAVGVPPEKIAGLVGG